MSLPIAIDSAGAADSPGITGSQPPVTGDWEINETTVVTAETLYIHGNITVRWPYCLRLDRSNLTVESGASVSRVFLEVGAQLVVDNSTLLLGALEASPDSILVLTDSQVATSGRLIAHEAVIRALRSTVRNEAPQGPPDGPGRDALMVLNGTAGSELRDSTVVNQAGPAGDASPGANGSDGGRSDLVLRVPRLTGCTVEVLAGRGKDGAQGIASLDGGAGGDGGDASLVMEDVNLERTNITVRASEGGGGALGTESPLGHGGAGGDGGSGGDAMARIASRWNLNVIGCTIRAYSGYGGPGGGGGGTSTGGAGDAGRPGSAGDVSLDVTSGGAIAMTDTLLAATGRDGGWGGDCGRAGDAAGAQGAPSSGGTGGDASITARCGSDLGMRRCNLTAMAGHGLDGGTGYEEGGRGGDGGSASLQVTADGDVDSEGLGLAALGGKGGNGGPAFSGIIGHGGSGGNASVRFGSQGSMTVRRFALGTTRGVGGTGANSWDGGEDGRTSMEVTSPRVEMWNGSIASGNAHEPFAVDAEVDLYNVSGEIVNRELPPTGCKRVRTWYPVDIRVVDNRDPARARPRPGFTIHVVQVGTRLEIGTRMTDANGIVSFWLQSFLYSPTSCEYLGGHLVTAIRPDGRISRTVRIDVQGPSLWPQPFVIALPDPWHPSTVFVESPENDKTYVRDRSNMTLEVYGYADTGDESPIDSVRVRLYPEGDEGGPWPNVTLALSSVLLSELASPDDRWGQFFVPEPNQNKWRFFFRCAVVGGHLRYRTGEYIAEVKALSGSFVGTSSTHFNLKVYDNAPPSMTIETDLDNVDWSNASSLTLSGTCSDDRGVLRVEVRVDGGAWEAANGTGNWSFQMDLAALAEGFHTIEVRANDGELVSPGSVHTFVIDRPEEHEGDGDQGMSLPLLGVAVLAILLTIVALLQIGLRRHRLPPAQ